MAQYSNIWMMISDEFGITCGEEEDLDQWKDRVLYSLFGRMALASLLDETEKEIISKVHMKNRVKTLVKSYHEMFPELNGLLNIDPEKISDEIFDIYAQTGALYQMPFRVQMSKPASAIVEGIRFTRGYPPDTRQMMSGLGTYICDSSGDKTISLTEMFQLEEHTLPDRWKLCVDGAQWSDFHSNVKTKYLVMKPPFSYGYWNDRPYSTGGVSLLRTGFPGAELYYLYKFENGRIIASQLPQWMVENKNYMSLSNACLYAEGTLPPTLYRYQDDFVYLRFQYLPPKREHYLWKLYSWPSPPKSLSSFDRICSKEVFEAIRTVMQKQGFEFMEER